MQEVEIKQKAIVLDDEEKRTLKVCLSLVLEILLNHYQFKTLIIGNREGLVSFANYLNNKL